MSGIGWTIYFLVLGGMVAFIIMRRRGQVPAKVAAEFVKEGAIIVDVRSPEEFSSGHLSQAFNIPLDGIEGVLPNKVKDKSRVILVHCQSGMRSKKAKIRLNQIGYKEVYDLGSYERAFKIVSGRHL
jgi:phage shock protein E